MDIDNATGDSLPVEPTQLEEDFNISPEHLEFAKCYLSTLDLNQTAISMKMDLAEVSRMLKHKSVRHLVDQAFLDQGYMNRNSISAAMTSVIEAKLEEMSETELVSGKDIAELLAMAHKMRMDEIKAQQKTAEIEALGKPKAPGTAIQINGATSSNYGSLLSQIMNGK